MERIEFLRAMSAARNAFRNELEKRGLHLTDFRPESPEKRMVYEYGEREDLMGRYVGEITFRQKFYDAAQGGE